MFSENPVNATMEVLFRIVNIFEETVSRAISSWKIIQTPYFLDVFSQCFPPNLYCYKLESNLIPLTLMSEFSYFSISQLFMIYD